MSLPGVARITVMTVLAELGDLTRFDTPRQLVGFLGLAPGEHSLGSRRRQGAITKAGKARVRRMLTEAAWACRVPARKTATCAEGQPTFPPRCTGHRLGRTRASVRPLREPLSRWNGKVSGDHGDRT